MHQLFSISGWNNDEFPTLLLGSLSDERVHTLACQALATHDFYRLDSVCRSGALPKSLVYITLHRYDDMRYLLSDMHQPVLQMNTIRQRIMTACPTPARSISVAAQQKQEQ
ncbi:MAG: hypothetical protein ABSD72_15395 [Terracidiphilus sp.]|jgi:hypothetical protein